MLTEDAAGSELFAEIESLVSSLGLRTVEASRSEHQGTTSIRCILMHPEREITTDDLAKAYNLIYPRYQILLSDRDLELEVSSPGLQRNLKDVHEFSLFAGKDARVYCVSRSSYIIGRIVSAEEGSLVLGSYRIEDSGEEGDSVRIPFSDIAKAKLEYRWEAKDA
ncbi:MAG: ribosome assembly cofactor RimP [Candidatus Ornithospirochaeta sp.]|nr:ribosome assembly cofactor RimP [Candidatus Ornithospirochaeta sp.]